MYKVNEEYDYLIKTVMIGDSGVGKSSIIKRFADNSFTPSYICTIGVDFEIRHVPCDGKVAKLQIWDTAGQERFRSITSSYYSGADVVVIVFDITDLESFRHVRRWLTDVKQYASDDVKLILIGNKIDRKDRQVSSSVGKSFAEKINCTYVECSAKTSKNITNVFDSVAREYVESEAYMNLQSKHKHDKRSLLALDSQPLKISTTCPTCIIL